MIAALRSPRFYGAAAARAFDGYLAAQSFAPEMLGLRALYDHRGSSSGKIVDLSGNGRPDATVGAGSNSPLWLPYTQPAVYKPAGVGNFVWCPDSAAVSLTGDFTLTAQVTMADWTAAGFRTALSKHDGTNNSWLLLLTAGVIRFYVKTTPTGIASADKPHGITGAGTWWIQVYRSAADGVVTYRKSADGVNWTSLGTNTIAPGEAVVDSSTVICLGKWGTSDPASGSDANEITIHKATLQSGLPTTTLATVADFDAALCTQTGHTDAYGNVWTVMRAAGGRKVVVQSPAALSDRAVWLYGTDDYTDLPATSVPAMALANAGEVLVVVRQWTTAASFGNYFSTRAAGAGQSGLAISSDGTTSTSIYGTISDGATTPSIFAPVAGAGVRNVIGLRRNTTTGLLHVNGVSGTSVSLAAVGATAGTTPRIGVRAGGSGYQDFEFEAFLSADRLLTTAELAQVVAFYGGGQ
jgi:hypothetical protein